MKVHDYYTITLFLFSNIINTGDVKYLLIEPEKELSLDQQNELAFLWNIIFYKYLDEKGDKETRDNFEIIIDVLEMEQEYNSIKGAVSLYILPTSTQDKQKLCAILEKYGQKIKADKELQPQIDIIERHLKILGTNIRQKKIQNDEIFKKVRKKVKMDMFRETAILHKILGIKLTPMTTTLPEYVAHLELAKQISFERDT